MMLDWAASIMVVSLIVFGLVVVSVSFFQSTDQDYVLRNSLSSAAHTIADEVDRVEGIAADISQPFYYNNSAQGVPMPAGLAGYTWSADFTHDFVVAVSNGSGPVMGSYVPLTMPVHLFPLSTVNYLAFHPISGACLHELDQGATPFPSCPAGSGVSGYNCFAFPSGINFQATQLAITVDGQVSYQTFVYAMNGYAYPCI